MKSIDVSDFYQWATIKNQFCKKIKESLIVYPELLLGINHLDWSKLMKQIPLIFRINIEHYILFTNYAI